jgi:2,4-dienoyl-CoA reductase-like NADH-dependent reductase (Old Yellow Enzyme family)
VRGSAAVRRVWPESAPLFRRISATDWIDGGWDLAQSVQLAKLVGPLGVDLIDCSSGGISPGAKIPVRNGYQVPFAEEIRRQTGLLTGAVGLISTTAQARAILQEGKADVVLLAREFLRQPCWPLHVANELGSHLVARAISASRARRYTRSRRRKPARFQALHGRPARDT